MNRVQFSHTTFHKLINFGTFLKAIFMVKENIDLVEIFTNASNRYVGVKRILRVLGNALYFLRAKISYII